MLEGAGRVSLQPHSHHLHKILLQVLVELASLDEQWAKSQWL